MKYLLIPFFAFITCSCYAQQYWSQTYDLFEHESEDIRDIAIDGSTIYASCRGTCRKYDVASCFKVAAFDLDGTFIDGYEDIRFEPGYGLEIDDDWLYVDGGNEPVNDKFIINRISKDLLTNDLTYASVDDAYFFANRSMVSNDRHVISFGSYRDSLDLEDNSAFHVNGVQVWVDKNSFAVDTIISITPTIDYANIYDMEVDAEGSIYSVGLDKQLNENGFKLTYHKIIKQNASGHVLWEYTFPLFTNGAANAPNDLLLFEDKTIFRGYDEDRYDAIHAISKEGERLWSYTLDHDFQKNIYPLNMVKSIDGHLMVLGSQQCYEYGWRQVGFITKIDQRTGDIIWDRTFELDKGLDPIPGPKDDIEFSKKSILLDLQQHENGDIYAAGLVDEPYDDPELGLRHDKDLWLLKLDSMGCLTPDCGYVQSLRNGILLNDSCKWLEDGAEWYYTTWGINTASQDLSQVSIIGDTLIGNRVCSVLGHFLEGEFVEGSQLVVFYDFENQKVLFNENEEFKVMYDFSMGNLPGDTIEYSLPKNFGLYDISTTGGGFDPSGKKYKYRHGAQEWVTLADGQQLRIVEAQELLEENGVETNCYRMARIIGGIGSTTGFLGQGCEQVLGGKIQYFRCFKSDAFEYSEVNGDCLATSVTELTDAEVAVFPNPTTRQLQFTTEITFSTINIYDVAGRTVSTVPYTSTIDIESMPSGIYMLELVGEKGVYRTKIVKE